MVIEKILEERSKTHGVFFDNASTSVALKRKMRLTKFWGRLMPDQEEALDCIMAKVSRILTGNPEHIDSWEDIAGYATLVADRLKEDTLDKS